MLTTKKVNVLDKNRIGTSIVSQDLEEVPVFAKPIIYCHFAEGMGEPKYMPIREWPQLIKLLDDALVNYNELV